MLSIGPTASLGVAMSEQRETNSPVRRAILGASMAALLTAVLPLSGGAEVRSSSPDVVIPAELGHLTALHASGAAPQRYVVLIQDLHASPEAQRNLAALLEHLAANYGVEWVLVEGGEGDVDLSHLRGLGSERVRRAVAEDMLSRGRLMGDEYADLVSQHDFTLWGIESRDLYERQYASFERADRLGRRDGPALTRLREALAAVQERRLNPRLLQLLSNKRAFRSGSIELAVYAQSLADQARSLSLRLEAWPSISRYLGMDAVQREINYEDLRMQQAEALAFLKASADPAELRALEALSEEVKSGRAEPRHYLEAFERLLEESAAPVGEWAALQRYFEFQRQHALLQPAELMGELDSLHARLLQDFIEAPHEAELLDLDERLSRLESLCALEWTVRDLEAYESAPETLGLAPWTEALRRQALAAGVAVAFDAETDLTELLEAGVDFYGLARARDAAMAQRALEKLHEIKTPVALVVGGFHTQRLVDSLLDSGAAVAVVTPAGGEDGNKMRYHLELKQRHAAAIRRRNAGPATGGEE